MLWSAMCVEHMVESLARCTVTGHMVGCLLQRPDALMAREWPVLPESAMSGGDEGVGGPNTKEVNGATGSVRMLGFPIHQLSAGAAAAALWGGASMQGRAIQMAFSPWRHWMAAQPPSMLLKVIAGLWPG
jgi:hypothetical protein